MPQGKELQLSIFEAFDRLPYLSSLGTDDIQELHINSQDLADADLVHIKGLTGLESLSLAGTCMGPCPLKGEGLVNLQGMTKLRSLRLDITSITDDNLAHLKSLKTLEKLRIHRNWQLTGAGLVHIENLRSLRELMIYSTPIEDDSLRHIKQLDSLEVLSLQSTKITDSGLAHLKGVHSDSLSKPARDSVAPPSPNVKARRVAARRLPWSRRSRRICRLNGSRRWPTAKRATPRGAPDAG